MAVLDTLLDIVTLEKINVDGVPSISMAYLEDGNISAKVVTNGKEDTDTLYQACSISKPITALAVAKLVDEGRFSYDTRVVEHLKSSTVDCLVESATRHLMAHVTVGMLISHTSGLSQGGFPGYAKEPPSAEVVLSGKAPSNTPKIRFISFPGAQYSYSGGGITVLQVFLENITAIPFVQLMDEIVLKPLAMSRSHYDPLPSREWNYATAHYTAEVETNAPYHHFIELAAAGLWTTPTDLLKAVAAVQHSLHNVGGFLKGETAKKMLTHTPQSPEPTAMALGWVSHGCVFGHSGGNDPGYACYAFGFHGGVVNQADDTSNMAQNAPRGSGFAIMTSSVYGVEAVQRVMCALYYACGWPKSYGFASHFGKDAFVPYPASEKEPENGEWSNWTGQYGEGWKITNDRKIAFGDLEPMRLKVAAMPTDMAKEGQKEYAFVVEGLEIAVRLTWKDDKRVLGLVQRRTNGGELKTLERLEDAA